MKISVKLAGLPMEIGLQYSKYLYIFAPFASEEPPMAFAAISPDELVRAAAWYPEGGAAYAEMMELCPRVSDALLPFRRLVFHSLAFEWRGRVWLLTGPSGAGKTTHYLRWKLRYGEELRLLNGDKPLLEIPPEGAITVHPSPWYGKEGMQQYFSGPLGGIILLEKAAENRMRRMTPREAAGCLFTQLLITRRDADSVRRACALEQALLERTPLWLLQNRGDSAAAELCRDTLSKELTQL